MNTLATTELERAPPKPERGEESLRILTSPTTLSPCTLTSTLPPNAPPPAGPCAAAAAFPNRPSPSPRSTECQGPAPSSDTAFSTMCCVTRYLPGGTHTTRPGTLRAACRMAEASLAPLGSAPPSATML